MRLSELTGRHRSTNYKVLARHGVSRRRRSPRPQTTRRFEWAEPGALLHMGLSGEVCVVVVTDSALVAGKDTDDHQDHL